MKKINIIFYSIIIIYLLIIFFIDGNSLNSLMINNDDIKVKEVAVLNVDYNKVIYNEEIIAKQEAERKYLENKKKAQSANQIVSSSGWVWPTEKNYTITTNYSSSHNAIDISQGYGSNIYAANSGTVTEVRGGCTPGNLSCNGRGGNYIVINHNNGYYTTYMHLRTIGVSLGQSVSSGQVIGTMGNTGNVIPAPTSSAPYLGTHLHFVVHKGTPSKGITINPMNLY
jgi:murein DD-endopeptidase MepM/ murein hydrolase activator NlpD